MKKFAVIIFLVFLVTGCGSDTKKVLKCSTSTERDGMKVDINLESGLENDTLSALKVETIYHIGKSLTEDKKDSFKAYVDSTMSSWNDMEGVKYDSKIESDKLYMTLDINVKTGKKALEQFGIKNIEISYDNLKKSLEEDNYTCQ